MHRGRSRSPARLLAPLALLLAAAAIVVIVQATTKDDDSTKGKPAATATDDGATTTKTTPRERPRRPSYTVKLNDTLGLISEKTGVSVERIQALNPELDPQNLIVGQKIKLRE
jgi:LysM repeat protein